MGIGEREGDRYVVGCWYPDGGLSMMGGGLLNRGPGRTDGSPPPVESPPSLSFRGPPVPVRGPTGEVSSPGKSRGSVGCRFTVIEVIVGRVPTALVDSVVIDSIAANLSGIGIALNESVLRRAFLAAVCILLSSALPASVFVSIPRIWTAAAVYFEAFLGSLEIAVLRSARTVLTASFLALAAALLASLFVSEDLWVCP